ncbi:MAG: UDP-N-acetylglucosamine--N-acetylmuramyl-(pentapeptide) pyrophosphoryl-undecaprenol N-acetylglucosamine transferase [Patescibacteria group bacterium]
MKIILLGGGSGGHFYPLMAVARALHNIAEDERIVTLDLTYMGDRVIDQELLDAEDIRFERISAGKIRNYFSILNIVDPFKTAWGIITTLWKFTWNPPDVIFSKGGYAAFPALFVARLYSIPVVIHESDSVPGKTNVWAGKFAKRIGVAFPEAAGVFPADKVALVGNPIRKEIIGGSSDEAYDMFTLESGIPVVLILGGSQGAEKINEIILEALPDLVTHVQVIHQTGSKNALTVASEAHVVLEKSPHIRRYHSYGFLNQSQLRNASFAATVAVSRAGSGSIFELAAWGIPSILIPLPLAAQDHQRENAYNYAREGAAEVLEETNLTPHVLIAEILKIAEDKERQTRMRAAARTFARVDAAEKIAREILALGVHE